MTILPAKPRWEEEMDKVLSALFESSDSDIEDVHIVRLPAVSEEDI